MANQRTPFACRSNFRGPQPSRDLGVGTKNQQAGNSTCPEDMLIRTELVSNYVTLIMREIIAHRPAERRGLLALPLRPPHQTLRLLLHHIFTCLPWPFSW